MTATIARPAAPTIHTGINHEQGALLGLGHWNDLVHGFDGRHAVATLNIGETTEMVSGTLTVDPSGRAAIIVERATDDLFIGHEVGLFGPLYNNGYDHRFQRVDFPAAMGPEQEPMDFEEYMLAMVGA